MSISRSLAVILVVASLAVAAQAAGGIKGQASQSGQVLAAIKGPRQQRPPVAIAAPLPPPPPAVFLPAPQQQVAAVKGPGQVVPVFSAARVAPSAPVVVVQEPAVIVQQQQPQSQQQVQVQVQEQEPEQQQQQVQEPSEVDPSAAAQDSAPAIAAPAVAAAPADSAEEANPRPEPYAFNYAFESGDQATSGSSQREEQQDASGRVTGFYTLRGEDGRDRRVDYVADANGFRATISTNEMGTAPKDSADTRWAASGPTDGQLRSAESATQAARQRALLNPQASQQQQQQVNFAGSASSASPSKIALPKKQPIAAAQSQQFVQQLQEPFEQIRQTELNSRARKSRNAPFYLFTN